jgi:hypothetical protein
MDLLEIIYYIGVGAVCFIAGMVVEMFIDNKAIMELQEDNRKLRLENEQLKTEAKHEVIEIVDNRTANGEFKFGGF